MRPLRVPAHRLASRRTTRATATPFTTFARRLDVEAAVATAERARERLERHFKDFNLPVEERIVRL